MPPRKSALPEGTDHVVRGASAEDEDSGSFASTKEKLVGQVREQVSSLRSQAGSRRGSRRRTCARGQPRRTERGAM